MNKVRNRILKTKTYFIFHWLFLFLTVTPLIVFLSSSWTGYYDVKLTPIDSYENISNKLYWYIFVSQQGTWLPVALLLISLIGFMMYSLTDKPSFEDGKNYYEMMTYAQVITDKHKELLVEFLNIVKEDVGTNKKDPSSITEMLQKTKEALTKRLRANKPLSAEKAKELTNIINNIILEEVNEEKPVEVIVPDTSKALVVAEQPVKANESRITKIQEPIMGNI